MTFRRNPISQSLLTQFIYENNKLGSRISYEQERRRV